MNIHRRLHTAQDTNFDIFAHVLNYKQKSRPVNINFANRLKWRKELIGCYSTQ